MSYKFNPLDIVGKKYGNWEVLSLKKYYKEKRAYIYKCKCECGSTSYKERSYIKSANSSSCKSCMYEKMKNTKSSYKSSIYRIWTGIRARCNNPRSSGYKRYGGRGIKVCKRWDKFKYFLKDMGPRPKGYSIERINNDGNYTKRNCKWASNHEQSRNTSRNRKYKYKGLTLTLTDWAEILEIKLKTLSYFLNKDKNRTIEDAKRYFSMTKEERIDFDSMHSDGFCMFFGEKRSRGWIAKRLGIGINNFTQRVKKTSCEEAIKYYSKSGKERRIRSYLKSHKTYKYKTLEKTAGAWAEYLKCDRHRFAKLIKKIGFEDAMRLYDIPRKGLNSQKIANIRNFNVKKFTGAVKLYTYKDQLLTIPEIASKINTWPQNILKRMKKTSLKEAIEYYSQK